MIEYNQMETEKPEIWLNLYHSDPDIYANLSAEHWGKASHWLMVKIFEHAKKQGYLQEDHIILDPFAGTARTNIIASMYGYRNIAVELEKDFAETDIPTNIQYAQNRTSRWKHVPDIKQGDVRNLPLETETVNAIITSPPYGDQVHNRSTEATMKALGKKGHEDCVKRLTIGYGETNGQIGILPIKARNGKEDYEQAMSKAYLEMARVTKLNGILITITKNSFKAKKIIDINKINKDLAEKAGFKLIETKLAEIVRPVKIGNDLFGVPQTELIGKASYFRRFHYKKNPDSLIQHEMIQFFKKV